MSKNLLFAAAFMAAFSMGAAQAQDSTSSPPSAVSQSGGTSMPSTDASGYGGAKGQSASGAMTNASNARQRNCPGPATFCDLYRGQ